MDIFMLMLAVGFFAGSAVLVPILNHLRRR